jgi:hypothetical protein
LTFKAFGRSVAISSVVWLLVYLIPWVFHFESGFWEVLNKASLIDVLPGTLFTLPFIIISDYGSLYLVRMFLVLARVHPVAASIGAFIFGFVVIAIIFWSLFVSFIPMALYLGHGEWARHLSLSDIMDIILYEGTFFGAWTPAFIIHLWLPLFALSTLIVRLVFWIFRAVEKAQWFLKGGAAHPFRVIGVVATIIVFGSAVLVKEGWALLGVLERS